MKKIYEVPNTKIVFISANCILAGSVMDIHRDVEVNEGLSRDFDAWDDED